MERPQDAQISSEDLQADARRCLLIDLDGTLVDSLADIAASVDHVRALNELPPLGTEGVRPLIGDGVRLLLSRSLAAADVHPNGEALERALAAYDAHHQTQCTANTAPYPGVAEQLARYREEGRQLAVVTNKPLHFAERILEHLGLASYFDTVLGGSCAAARKPDPAPLRLALDRLGAQPRDATMIGDGLPDLRSGRAAGTGVVAVTYGFTPAERLLAEEPDLIWSTFGSPEDAPR